MPVLSAEDALKLISHQQRYAGILKLVWSTSNRTDHIEACTRHGARHYFVKPDSMQGLVETVELISKLLPPVHVPD
jgi:DNA-binding NarL/FixJ family response regulator